MAERTIWQYLDDPCFRCAIGNISRQERTSLPYLRIYFVLSGTLNLRIGQRSHSISTDEIAMINPFESFYITQDGGVAAAFDLDLAALGDSSSELWFSRVPVSDTDREPLTVLKALLSRFVKFNIDFQEDRTLLNRSMYYAVMHHLITFFRVDKPQTRAGTNSKAELMEQITQYIDCNYRQNLSLHSLAERFYLSAPYLSKLFKQFHGATFSEYLVDIRLQNCLHDLLNTGQSVEVLSVRYGFPNPRSFISHFKGHYGVTPSLYRKQHRESQTVSGSAYPDVAQNNALEPFAKYLTTEVIPGQNTEDRPTVLVEVPVCDITQAGTALYHRFRNMISIHSARDILMAQNQNMLRTLQQEVGFRYIHFHGILDDGLFVYDEDSDGKPAPNFTFVDTILDFLYSIGLRPFIELSYMPRKLARPNAKEGYYDRSAISLPSDFKKWGQFVRLFVQHLDQRYGSNEVAQWPFSLWNLPDSGESFLGLGSAEDYFGFYQCTWHAVRTQNPHIPICGPSCLTETAESGDFLPAFLHLCQENHCLPDMLQYHFYPLYIESLGQAQQRLLYRYSPDALKQSIAAVRSNLRSCPGGLRPLHITEWNASPSHRELLSDTVFQAAYITKNVLENFDAVESLCYCTLADPVTGSISASHLFHGGLGLFTYNGIKKASYQALRLLARLGGAKLASGDGYFITRGEKGCQIMLYNYQHYSELYANGETFDMTFTDRYTPFPNGAKKRFSVLLEGLDSGEYRITESILNRDHGSSFDKWVQSGAMPVETSEDIEYLRCISLPAVRKRTVTVKNGKLELSFTLDTHEVRLVEFTKQ